MKAIFIITILITTRAFAQSGLLIENDPIDLNGTIKRESIEDKLQNRRRKLEAQTMKRLYLQMEKQRVISEILLSRKMEKAMQASLNKSELE
jgi:hypothetical protein